MKNETHHLLQLRGLLDMAQEIIDRLADDAPPGPDEQAILAAAAMAIGEAQPRTRKDIHRFVEALTAGDDGWLLVHSIPGEHRIDALYAAKLPASVRKLTGL